MKIYKPYEPTISSRKLRNLTQITEKNIGNVRGQLNRFFSKPTVVLRGFIQKVVDIETYDYDGVTYPYNIYSEEYYPNYVPFEGGCVIHQLWEDHLNGKSWFSRNPNDIPRLAITSKFCTSCVPISIGDSYKIYGNRLIIMYKWNKYVHHTPWLRFNEFIQVESHDEDELKSVRASGCVSRISNTLYDYREVYEYRLDDLHNSYHIQKFIEDINIEITDRLYSILLDNYDLDEISEIISIYGDDYLKMTVYPKKAFDPHCNETYCKFINLETNTEYSSYIDALDSVINPMIDAARKSHNECIDDDFDYYFEYD